MTDADKARYGLEMSAQLREELSDYANELGVTDAEVARRAIRKEIDRKPSDSRLGTFLEWLSAAALTGTLYIVGFVVVLDAPYGREAWVAMFVTVWILAMWGAHETGARDLTIREWVASIRS